jgi:lipoate-protein ligase A
MELAVPIDQAMRAEMAALTAVADGTVVQKHWFWESSQCLVVPRSYARLAGFAAGVRALEELKWPIVLRHTGGGITPQGPGILNVSMVFCAPVSAGIEGTFNTLCTPIENTLRDAGFLVTRGCLGGAFCDGAHNILADGRKFAGTAQRQ